MVLKYGNLIMPLFKASVTAKGTIYGRWVYIELFSMEKMYCQTLQNKAI